MSSLVETRSHDLWAFGAASENSRRRKCACQLNQAFVKISVRAVFVFQPDMFKDIVRLVKFLFIEQLKIAGVMRVEISFAELLGHRGDAFALVAHGRKVKSKPQSLKSKVAAPIRILDIGLEALDLI